jgi:hypothetical protein
MPVNLVILLNPAFVASYIFWQGFEKFLIESYGTLILSPLIYIRLAPEPWSIYLLKASASSEWFCLFLCGIPLLMISGAAALLVRAFIHQCMTAALVAMLLVVMVFSVYHSVKHLGFTVT